MANFLTFAGSAIEAIRINRIALETRDGHELWVKQRQRWSGPVIRCANLFFRLAGQPMSVRIDTQAWQRWETGCFNLLNGENYRAFAEEPRRVCVAKIPGTSIARHFEQGTFSEEMLDAAAAELRRAHELHSGEFNGPWSHGDANLANFLIDSTTGRARMIDFEIIHHPLLPYEQRQADDLLVFLQDLCGCISPDRWLPAALGFLEAYGRVGVINRLKGCLRVPSGLMLAWWVIRSNYVPPALLHRRFNALHGALNREISGATGCRASSPPGGSSPRP